MLDSTVFLKSQVKEDASILQLGLITLDGVQISFKKLAICYGYIGVDISEALQSVVDVLLALVYFLLVWVITFVFLEFVFYFDQMYECQCFK